LVVGEETTHARVADLPSLLRPGDLLVLNDVRVRRARLPAVRQSGGAVEVLLVGAGEALCRPSRRLRAGEALQCGSGTVTLVEPRGEGRWAVRCEPDEDALADAVGQVPLPPYFGRDATPEDERRYQTVYARRGELAAAAAPTAGLHFTPELLERVRHAGVSVVSVTLEVGLGTFKPLTAEQLLRGELHEESFDVPEASWSALAEARARGGRVIAVGTTTARVLESATGPGRGSTRAFFRRPGDLRVVDVLFTNFHLPRSSLLMLVTAFAGHERVMDAYALAVREGYRFYSYGDACLLTRADPGVAR
jgi:S-adenosylmethionine:tRNA ribosyltransferase-isomerase